MAMFSETDEWIAVVVDNVDNVEEDDGLVDAVYNYLQYLSTLDLRYGDYKLSFLKNIDYDGSYVEYSCVKNSEEYNRRKTMIYRDNYLVYGQHVNPQGYVSEDYKLVSANSVLNAYEQFHQNDVLPHMPMFTMVFSSAELFK